MTNPKPKKAKAAPGGADLPNATSGDVARGPVVAWEFADGGVMRMPLEKVFETVKKQVAGLAHADAMTKMSRKGADAAKLKAEAKGAATLEAVRREYEKLQTSQKGRGATAIISNRLNLSLPTVRAHLKTIRGV